MNVVKKIGENIRRFTSWIGSIGNSPGDSPELRSHKIILTVAMYAGTLNLLYFSVEYFNMGRDQAGLTLLVFASFLTLNVILFRFHRNFIFFRDTVFVGYFFYLIVYHTIMGGYIGSVFYVLYAIVVISGAQILYQKRSHRVNWYFLYMITGIVLYFLEPYIAEGMVPLPQRIVLLTLVNNFVLIASLIFLTVNYYTNILKAEKLKTDELIHSILPAPVVSELNTHGKSNPIMIPRATAIFMDFVGFTRITQEMGPRELVSILNEHFTNFDQIFLQHKVEKLKTIGDGYMAVGGLPEPNDSHPLDVALAAMKVILYMEEKNKENTIKWKLRIGIHTGPMVAGIIGETKFSYDVWGSSVNLCSRLETASMPDCINVSEEFMEYTKDFFEFEPRGSIEIKNRAPVKMYFLTDIKKKLRTDHFQPNELFYEMYKQYAPPPVLEI